MKGVIVASNFGRDAEPLERLREQSWGAKYGAHNIPEHWIEKTRFPSGTCLKFTEGIDIRDYAEKLTEIIMKNS